MVCNYVFTDEEWLSFCRVIGNPTWAKNPQFTTLKARKANEGELDRLVEEWTVNHSPEEVMAKMQTAGVAAGVLETVEDMMEYDPQFKHRHYFLELDHPEIGKHRVGSLAFILSKTPCEVRRAPLLGEHNEYVLKQLIGMTDGEFTQLKPEGIIE